MSWRSALTVILLATLMPACRDTSKAAPRDAMADAKAANAPAPWVGTVAARGVGWQAGLVRIQNDDLVLRTGPYLYTIDRNGEIARIGAPAAYRAFLEEEDVELGGPNPRTVVASSEEISGTMQAPFIRLRRWGSAPPDAPRQVLAWNGSTWAKATGPRPPEEEDYRELQRTHVTRSTAGLPADHVWRSHLTTKSRIVWIGHRRKAGFDDDGYDPNQQDVTAIAPVEGSAARLIELPDADSKAPADAAPKTAGRFCHFLESADESAYLSCTSVTDGKDVTRFYQLEGERWTPFPLAAIGRALQVIDAEGTLWYLDDVAGVGRLLMRVAKGSAPEEVELPAPPPDLSAPSYRAHGDVNYESWENASFVRPAPPIRMHSPHSISARRSGDVWVVGQDSGADPRLGSSVVRYTRGGRGARPPILLRSDADQRNEILNARGMRKWTPTCNSAFVPFPGEDAGDARAGSAFFTAHEKEIATAIGKIDEGEPTAPPIQVAIVSGNFDGRPVTGAVFLRTEPTARPQSLAAAVARVAAIATAGARTAPAVTCSVPTLDALIATLH